MWFIRDADPSPSPDAKNNNNSHQKRRSGFDLLLDDRRTWHFPPSPPSPGIELWKAQSVVLLEMRLESTTEVGRYFEEGLSDPSSEILQSRSQREHVWEAMPWTSSLSPRMKWCPLMWPDTHGHFLLITSQAQPLPPASRDWDLGQRLLSRGPRCHL